MGWSKTKTIVVVSAVVLIGAGTAMTVHWSRLRAERKKDPIAFEVKHQSPVHDTEKLHGQLVGKWEMFAMKSWGATQVSYAPKTHDHFKIFTETNWFVVQYDSDSNVVYSAGGAYKLIGNDYAESIDTATGGMTKFLGAHPRFKIRIEGDKYYQVGAGKNPAIEEIWQRVRE